ncbi:AI-2E family transporter [Lacticigenium naphthae]|uniref:AI-2E family transporter n=1 Tax=Lacticigenium naphthae TaxID=515351 RepID=UPI000403C3F4|nr:AI-2E family transporter [Lacticigenium naphthae]
MKNWKDSNVFFVTLWLLIIVMLVYYSLEIEFFLNPLIGILTALFTPLLVAGFLYYLLNPFVILLEKIKLKRIYGIILALIVLLGIITLFITLGIPVLLQQFSLLIAGIPSFIKQLESLTIEISQKGWAQQIDFQAILASIDIWLSDTGTNLLNNLVSSVGETISKITDTIFLFITVPVILFYMLHDGWKFPNAASKIFPEKYQESVEALIRQIGLTISSYISGKGMASLIVGIFLYITYSLASLPFALLISVFAGLTNFIPYVGPFIGAAPAVIVGLTISPVTAVVAAILVLVIQQVDSNFLTPLFVGKSLAVHPLTVILILLAAGNIAGLLGMLIGVPLYAIFKTIVLFIVESKKQSKAHKKGI